MIDAVIEGPIAEKSKLMLMFLMHSYRSQAWMSRSPQPCGALDAAVPLGRPHSDGRFCTAPAGHGGVVKAFPVGDAAFRHRMPVHHNFADSLASGVLVECQPNLACKRLADRSSAKL